MACVELKTADPPSLYSVNVTVAVVAPEFAIANPVDDSSVGAMRFGKTKFDWACAATGRAIHNDTRLLSVSQLVLRASDMVQRDLRCATPPTSQFRFIAFLSSRAERISCV